MNDAPKKQIAYAKVRVTPNWANLHVLDVSSRKLVRAVIEVDTCKGFLVRYQTDVDGRFLPAFGGFLTEQLKGQFEIITSADAR